MRYGSLLAVLLLVACSSAGDDSTDVTSPPATATSIASGDAMTASDESLDGDSVVSEVPASEIAATVEVVLDSEAVTVSGDLAGSNDPFGDFVSCSGVREAFTTYSVLVSATSGDVRSVSVVTNGVVVSEGIHDAVARVEFADGTAIDAVGTITLLPGYQTGSFIAFDSAGTPVEGSFSCTGPPGARPIDIGVDDGALEQIDVFALLRRGDESRLVGFAVSGESSAAIACPGAVGVDAARVVAVTGDESMGAITAFTLDGGPEPALSMQVGAVTYDFPDVTLSDANSGTAGSFSAQADGVAVDGAYRCS